MEPPSWAFMCPLIHSFINPSLVFKNFTDEYKTLLLQAENAAKSSGYGSLESSDLVLEVLRLKSGDIYAVFSDFGINEKVFVDVLTHPRFQPLINRQ